MRGDVQLRHFGQRNFLLYLPPFGKEILDLLRHRLLARGNSQKQDHFRARLRKQFPGTRGCRRLFSAQPLGQFLGMVFQIAPRLHQILARNRATQIRNVLITQSLGEACGQKIHHGRRGIRRISQFRHLLTGLQQLTQLCGVNLGAGPVLVQNLQPAFFLQNLDDMQRIVFVS